MIEVLTYFQGVIFTIAYWGSLVGAMWFVIAGPNLDENDKTLGGACYNYLIRILLL